MAANLSVTWKRCRLGCSAGLLFSAVLSVPVDKPPSPESAPVVFSPRVQVREGSIWTGNGGYSTGGGVTAPPGPPDQREGRLRSLRPLVGESEILMRRSAFSAQCKVQQALLGPSQDGPGFLRHLLQLPAVQHLGSARGAVHPRGRSPALILGPTAHEGSHAPMHSSLLCRRQVPSCASHVLTAILLSLTLLWPPSPMASLSSGAGHPDAAIVAAAVRRTARAPLAARAGARLRR
ncbi:hypothetical protein NDU88_004491 [Pleurodeles waltl]|uniref:Uncharacterized protein n=1 Tax=Pleurodeles waltl TaxID=8319 RepID=A0AAV7WWR0_PLEWA|nr:hypothetical protein NDU88_004491 [Pleurodeles waltl]